MNWLKPSYRRRFVTATIVISLAISLSLSISLLEETAAQTTHEVKIAGFAFVPQNMTINLGDSIKWNNTDPVIHTLWFVFVANGSTYLLSDPILPSTTWTHTFNEAVKLQYYSFDMLWITGSINVTAEVRDVAVTNIVTSKTGCFPIPTVGQNYTIRVNVTVENKGDLVETFNVTAYANSSTIGKQEVTLVPSETRTLTFTWDTTDFDKGNYTISAYAWPVSDETNLGNNTLEDGEISVAMLGDLDASGKVGPYDFYLFARGYGSTPTMPNWNPNADFDESGKVGPYDFYLFARNYGKQDP